MGMAVSKWERSCSLVEFQRMLDRQLAKHSTGFKVETAPGVVEPLLSSQKVREEAEQGLLMCGPFIFLTLVFIGWQRAPPSVPPARNCSMIAGQEMPSEAGMQTKRTVWCKQKKLIQAKAAWLCRVCLTNEVDMTIVPWVSCTLSQMLITAVSRCPIL
ncbi:hypothetical protein NC653_012445 [Populus alba x Populus x berolinensis]|uniref:Uncharacterized protein n=1 Tax=Populus alba x Populus x berolinensis TaxID=444605 RepID=A0AAD6QS13_9ROSI|nr:hypothetical protein NC653_012445 [Populus alba x Populus x berolinensis]